VIAHPVDPAADSSIEGGQQIMRYRSWTTLLLIASLVILTSVTAGANKQIYSVPEEPGYSSGGGKVITDGDGGDPDGVGLENPSGGQQLHVPPAVPEEGTDMPGPSANAMSALEMLRIIEATVYFLIR
jgi:hypothetical protein